MNDYYTSMDKRTKEREAYLKRIREARLHVGYTQAEMAEKIGVDRPTYTNYELRRTMPQRYIAKFCKATGIRADWLLTGRLPMEEEVDIHEGFFDEVNDVWKAFHTENKQEVIAFMNNLLKLQKAKEKLKKPKKTVKKRKLKK